MKQLDMFEELKSKIYESPDKGKTVYEREFGGTERKLVQTDLVKNSVQQQWNVTFGSPNGA